MHNDQLNTFVPQGHIATFQNGAALVKVSAEHVIEIVRTMYADPRLSFKAITATDERAENHYFKVWYIFGVKGSDQFVIPYLELTNTESFPSISPFIREAGNFELKIRAFMGLVPEGHPDPRRLILHEAFPDNFHPLCKEKLPPLPQGEGWGEGPGTSSKSALPGTPFAFTQVSGEGVYEIPVGPIHAGIIEPGHFRISVMGEEIVNLEPRLGFVHKGSEKLFETLSLADTIRLSEKISGDTAFNHSLAYCQAVEKLAGIEVPAHAAYLRVIYAEIERLANHISDVGGILVDTGFNFGGASGARLREQVMQLAERLTGNRFLRGVNTIGGVTKDLSAGATAHLVEQLTAIQQDLNEAIDIVEQSASVLNRLKTTGTIPAGAAARYGARGVAARCTGLTRDARTDHPYAAYGELECPVAIETTGDVYARFHVRLQEINNACTLITEALQNLPTGPIQKELSNIALQKNAYAIGIAEGHRGENIYFVATDSRGNIARVDVTDPSFLNWDVTGSAAPGNIVPDFPLVNKSFGLSYSGYDL